MARDGAPENTTLSSLKKYLQAYWMVLPRTVSARALIDCTELLQVSRGRSVQTRLDKASSLPMLGCFQCPVGYISLAIRLYEEDSLSHRPHKRFGYQTTDVYS